MKPVFDDLTLTLLVGDIFAAFAAFVYILQLPPDQRPSWSEILGRMGTAMVGAFAVGWAVNFFWGWTGNAIYAVCALCGIFGDRVFQMISGIAKSRGIPLEYQGQETRSDPKPPETRGEESTK